MSPNSFQSQQRLETRQCLYNKRRLLKMRGHEFFKLDFSTTKNVCSSRCTDEWSAVFGCEYLFLLRSIRALKTGPGGYGILRRATYGSQPVAEKLPLNRKHVFFVWMYIDCTTLRYFESSMATERFFCPNVA